MAAELKPYQAYKDSGVESLGDVPAHWEVRQLGRIGRFMKGGGGTKEDEREDGIPCVRYGDLYTQHQLFITKTRACVTPELASTVYTPIRYGDVLFAGSGEKAVQTLSRLDRAHPQKYDVFVLDFLNNPDSIRNAFADFIYSSDLKVRDRCNPIPAGASRHRPTCGRTSSHRSLRIE